MNEVIVLPALGDNYIYLLQYGPQTALAVDPAVADIVLDELEKRALTLKAILVTHHHGDHTGGIKKLKKETGCLVIGPDRKRISGLDQLVSDEDNLNFDNLPIRVIATPGHTRTSVCYEISVPHQEDLLFTGDTLFVGGCGRPFECQPEVLFESLQQLALLSDETKIYCGHDYTVENFEFALSIEPDNTAVREALSQVKEVVRQRKPTVPSTIGKEKRTNIFLRSTRSKVREALDMPSAPPEAIFTELRKRKNWF